MRKSSLKTVSPEVVKSTSKKDACIDALYVKAKGSKSRFITLLCEHIAQEMMLDATAEAEFKESFAELVEISYPDLVRNFTAP